MRRLALLSLAAFALMAGVVVYAGRVVRRAPGLVIDLARVQTRGLDEAARAQLDELTDDVLVTYYVSSRDVMPSHLKRLEADVTARLEMLARASGGRLRYQIVDPGTRPELAEHAARMAIAPFRVRTVARDAYEEEAIWSSLAIAYGPRPEGVISAVTDEHVPRLVPMILGTLRQMDAPRAPVFGVAGEGADALAAHLATRGEVRRLVLDEGAPIPDGIDLLFWLDPRGVDARAVDALGTHLRAGRAAVVAGSPWRARVVDADEQGEPRTVAFERTGVELRALLRPFGLSLVDALVCDGFGAPLAPGGRVLPYRIRCIAPNQDFRRLAREARGNLLFETPAALAVDPLQVDAVGRDAGVLATTSERTTLLAVPPDPVAVESLPSDVRGADKQPLMVALRPRDPWAGTLVALGSASALRALDVEGFAHRHLVDTLVDSFASAERLVIHRLPPVDAGPLPALPADARRGWRAFVVLSVPALLALAAVLAGRSGRARRGARLVPVLPALLALAGAAGLVRAAASLGARADWSAERVNVPAPATLARARALPDPRIELVTANLTPELLAVARRARGLLAEIARGSDAAVRVVTDADLDPARRAELLAAGLEPRLVRSVEDESGRLREAWCGVTLSAGGRREVLPFLDARALGNLEFRVAFALERLARGRAPRVAFLSDNLRLSAAEAYEDYQRRGLFAPSGSDAYAQARALVADNGFDVVHVDPRDPEGVSIPEDVDLVVWMQPRRDVTRALGAVVEHLDRGGRVLLAAQHYEIVPQQYQGREFEVVFWPRPQHNDLDAFYLPQLGITLAKEVLFDRLDAPLEEATAVHRGGGARRAYAEQASAQSFQIRAIGAHFDPEHPITAQLGDQLFVAGNRIVTDPDELARHGLRARTLLATSDDARAYDWRGGYLPEAALEGIPGEGVRTFDAGQPLGVLVQGDFPGYAFDDEAFTGTLVPGGPQDEGTLLLLGGSRLFENGRLFADDYQHDQLLMNAVAWLALGDELGAIQARRLGARGFEPLPPEATLRWRAAVLGGAPVLLVAAGLLAARRRRRPVLAEDGA